MIIGTVHTVFFYRGVSLKKMLENKNKFFPQRFQDLAMKSLQVTYSLQDKANWNEKGQTMFKYVANARKRWLTRSEYQLMIRDLQGNREEVKKYDKVHWVDTR